MKPKKIVKKHIKNQIRAICAATALSDEEKAAKVCELAGYDGMARFLEDRKEQTAGLTQLQKEYKAFFFDLLAKHGVSSPTELDDAKKKEFFKEVRDRWATGEGVSKSKNMMKQEDEGEQPQQEKASEQIAIPVAEQKKAKARAQQDRALRKNTMQLETRLENLEREAKEVYIDSAKTNDFIKQLPFENAKRKKDVLEETSFRLRNAQDRCFNMKSLLGDIKVNLVESQKTIKNRLRSKSLEHTAGTETAARKKNKKKKEKTIWHVTVKSTGSRSVVIPKHIKKVSRKSYPSVNAARTAIQDAVAKDDGLPNTNVDFRTEAGDDPYEIIWHAGSMSGVLSEEIV